MRQSSIEAHEEIKPHKVYHYGIIEKSIQEIGVPCHGRQVSENCNLDYHAVMRRLSEMESKGIIKVVGRASNVNRKPLLWNLIN